MNELNRKFEAVLWVARTLFELQRATGSSSNISFKHDGKIYISATNSSFGALTKDDFAVLDLNGRQLSEVKPSKEWPMHLMLYKNRKEDEVVIHTHSTYATLWSCIPNLDINDCVPDFTPYLSMKVGPVKWVPYAKPGSSQLFESIEQNLQVNSTYLLAHHGPVLSSRTILDAFYAIEELEESCRIAWFAQNSNHSIRRIKEIEN